MKRTWHETQLKKLAKTVNFKALRGTDLFTLEKAAPQHHWPWYDWDMDDFGMEVSR